MEVYHGINMVARSENNDPQQQQHASAMASAAAIAAPPRHGDDGHLDAASRATSVAATSVYTHTLNGSDPEDSLDLTPSPDQKKQRRSAASRRPHVKHDASKRRPIPAGGGARTRCQASSEAWCGLRALTPLESLSSTSTLNTLQSTVRPTRGSSTSSVRRTTTTPTS